MRWTLLGAVALAVLAGAGTARGADAPPASGLSGPEFKARLAKAIEAQQKGWVPPDTSQTAPARVPDGCGDRPPWLPRAGQHTGSAGACWLGQPSLPVRPAVGQVAARALTGAGAAGIRRRCSRRR